jgi:hypothetical protein
MLDNFSQEKLTLPNATVLGLAEEVSEDFIDQINFGNPQDTESPIDSNWEPGNKALYKKLLGGKLDHLGKHEKCFIEPVLRNYTHVFHDEETNDFKSTNVVELVIVVTDRTPIRCSQYRTPFALRREIESQVNDMFQKGVTGKSQLP